MSDEIYFDYNPWWDREHETGHLVERPVILDKMETLLSSKSIVFLTGLRRIGKTSMMKLFIRRLLDKDIPPSRILYVSLDDYLLENKSIIDIVDDFRRIQKLRKEDKIYLFLDEIGSKEKFQQQLKNLYDKYDLKIYAASSSSSVLKDRKAFLTGREYVLEVLPLDFSEYLSFKQVIIKKRDKPLLESHFEDFLHVGGIPEYVLFKERGYVHALVDDIITKDIIAYHKIRNPQVIKDFFLFLMTHTCGPVSLYKISNILKISSETAARYLQYLVDTYLVYLVPRFGKTKQALSSPKKIYAPDLGIRHIFTSVGPPRKGKQFENYVYLEIKHTDVSYVYENQTEIDFLVNRQILVESKYNDVLTPGQEVLFREFQAKEKRVIQNNDDLLKLKQIVSL